MNDMILEAIREDAENLIRVAQTHNAVVTITLEPQEPLAMGNYKMVADVRSARQRAASSFDLDATCDAAMALLASEIESHVKYHRRSMSASYSEVKRAMDTRHDHYRKEMVQMAWANMANLGMYEAAQALHRFAQSYSNLRKSSVTFFPPLN